MRAGLRKVTGVSGASAYVKLQAAHAGSSRTRFDMHSIVAGLECV